MFNERGLGCEPLYEGFQRLLILAVKVPSNQKCWFSFSKQKQNYLDKVSLRGDDAYETALA